MSRNQTDPLKVPISISISPLDLPPKYQRINPKNMDSTPAPPIGLILKSSFQEGYKNCLNHSSLMTVLNAQVRFSAGVGVALPQRGEITRKIPFSG